MILVDTNVLLDVFQDDSQWAKWSQDQLDTALLTDRLAINAVIYAELSIAYSRIEDLEKVVAGTSLKVEAMPREALFLAGKVYRDYRRKQGRKTGVLPDFFIGAHAAVQNCPILTRDTAHYRTYFPGVRLICP